MNKAKSKSGLSYKDAGVDIAAGNRLVEQIKSITKETHRPEVLTNIGGFGGLFALDKEQYKNPVLVSATDGVGTKLKLAQIMDDHTTIGIDLVAMCVNDIIVGGAEPLFFLDYFATGRLDPDHTTEIVRGIGEGCKQAGCALIGGETAEMPGLYQGDDYDLAGFSVGIVDRDKIIDGSAIKQDDLLIALASSGPHSNGFSLIRKILDTTHADLDQPFGDSTLGETLLTPTKIYVKSLLKLFTTQTIHGLAHITGGGLLENIPRILPAHLKAVIDTQSWQWPPIFHWLQKGGNIADEEMVRTFNCGVGMILAVAKEDADHVISQLQKMGEHAWRIGVVDRAAPDEKQVQL